MHSTQRGVLLKWCDTAYDVCIRGSSEAEKRQPQLDVGNTEENECVQPWSKLKVAAGRRGAESVRMVILRA